MKEVFHHFLFCAEDSQPTTRNAYWITTVVLLGGSLVDIAYAGRRR